MSPENDPQSDILGEIDKLEARWRDNPKGRVFAHLADGYRKLGDHSKAEGLILHGLKNHPNYISAYIVLGRIYLDSERLSDAHTQLSKVLELDPQNLIALKLLGDLATSGGRVEDARSWYERMLLIDSRSEEANQALAALEGGVDEEVAEEEALVHEEPTASLDTPDSTPPAPVAADEPEAETPWESTLTGTETDESNLEKPIAPVEGLLSHDRERPEGETPVEVPFGSEAPDAMPWEQRMLDDDAEVAEPAEASTPEPTVGEVGRVNGEAAEDPLAAEVAGADTQEADSGDAAFNLDEMGAWTPGYLGGEAGQAEGMPDSELFGDLDSDDVSFDLSAVAGEEMPTSSELGGDDEEGNSMVTETMAELYAEQGLYDDALDVYRQLLEMRPNDEGLLARVAEIEAQRQTPAEDGTPPEFELEAVQDPFAETVEPIAPDLSEAQPSPPAAEAPPIQAAPGTESEDAEAALPSMTDFAQSTNDGERSSAAFEFATAAPDSALSDVDPFAGSFDLAASRAGDQEDGEPAGMLLDTPADEAAPDEVFGSVTSPIAEPAAAQPEPAAVESPVAESLAILDDVASADVAEVSEAPAEDYSRVGGTAEEPDTRGETIEDYLTKLLIFDSGSGASDAEESGPHDQASASSPSSAAGGDTEDMAQFQEWLRSLKR